MAEAVKSGLIEVIATDHAPWSDEKKLKEFKLAPNGISGIETAIALTWTALVVGIGMHPSDFISRFTAGPAKALGLRVPSLAPGTVADITIIDPVASREVIPAQFLSKGKSSPASGMKLCGWPYAAIIGGSLVMQGGEVRRVRI